MTLFLCGDVMLGRGVDQILPHPGDPALREGYLADARGLRRTWRRRRADRIPAPVAPCWPWGEALRLLEEAAPDVRIVNLETAVTRSDEFAPGKAVHYRMHPGNVSALAAARPDVCVLANNHVLDFGRPGLDETLRSLAAAGLRAAGAGRSADEAYAPAAVPSATGGRVLLFALGARSSGVPPDWAAAAAGRRRLRARAVGRHGGRRGPAGCGRRSVRATSRSSPCTGDPTGATSFRASRSASRTPWWTAASTSSTGIPRTIPGPSRCTASKLILYGCGDFIDDYEGITGYEAYRDDLRLRLPRLGGRGHRVAGRGAHGAAAVRRMRLEPAVDKDRRWLRATLDRISNGVHITQAADGALRLLPATATRRTRGGGSTPCGFAGWGALTSTPVASPGPHHK